MMIKYNWSSVGHIRSCIKLVLGILICMYHLVDGRPEPNTCNATLGQYPTFSGECPSGTIFDDDTKCCLGCLHCGPGWRRSSSLDTACEPCPIDHYSNLIDNNFCLPCSSCEQLHRYEESACVAARNAKCGECMEGFWEHPDLPSHQQQCLLMSKTSSKPEQHNPDSSSSPENVILKTSSNDGIEVVVIVAIILASVLIILVLVTSTWLWIYQAKYKKALTIGGPRGQQNTDHGQNAAIEMQPLRNTNATNE